MVKILLAIALAVIIGTATLGYLTMEKVKVLQSVLDTTKKDLAATKETLRKTKEELKVRTEELAVANATIETRNKEIADLKGQIDDLNKKIAEAAAAMEAKTAAMDALQKEFDAYKIATGLDPKKPNQEDSPVVLALKADLVKAQAEAAESKALVDVLNAKKKELEDKMVVLEQYKKRKETEIMRIGVGGRVLAVNGGWNFVVLSIGDKQGAAMNATLMVVRDGLPIGKVRITSVEPSSSIADILPGSVRKGVTIQPGDSVIFEGRTPATGTAPPAPAGAPQR